MEDGSEVSVASTYCVVYRLEKGEWNVTGEGWAQVIIASVMYSLKEQIYNS